MVEIFQTFLYPFLVYCAPRSHIDNRCSYSKPPSSGTFPFETSWASTVEHLSATSEFLRRMDEGMARQPNYNKSLSALVLVNRSLLASILQCGRFRGPQEDLEGSSTGFMGRTLGNMHYKKALLL